MTLFSRVRNSKGNIFAMLFAAVAMTGVLGVVGMHPAAGQTSAAAGQFVLLLVLRPWSRPPFFKKVAGNS